MIKEYAIEPAALNNFDHCRYILEKFSVSRGRVISRFPKEWLGMVKECWQELLPREKSRIIEYLNHMDVKKKLIASNRAYNRTLPWLQNAEEQHLNHPFHAIITNANPNNNPAILLREAIDETTPLMCVDRTMTINRKPRDMANCVAPLLQIAKKIIFIDPHFEGEARHLYPLREFLNVIFNRNPNFVLDKIEYHCNVGPTKEYFATKLGNTLFQDSEVEASIHLFCWDATEMHNRFILTEIGGVMFGTGLDDDSQGRKSKRDIVSLLDETSYQEEWDKFSNCQKEPFLIMTNNDRH